MLALKESDSRNDREQEEQEVMDQVRAGMLALVEEQTEVKRRIRRWWNRYRSWMRPFSL